MKIIKIMSIILICLLTMLINYKQDVSNVLAPDFSGSAISRIFSLAKMLALTGGVSWIIFLLVGPVVKIIGALPNIPQGKILSELEDAQEYAAEILRRLIRALPFEEVLFRIAGADKKHIHTYEDKVKYKTLAIIMVVVAIYIAVAIYYLLATKGVFYSSLPATDVGVSIFDKVIKNVNNIANQYSFTIAAIFSIFIFCIDRMIVSDHNIEYRLFKIRLQSWLEKSKKIDIGGVSDNRSSPRACY